MVKRVFSKSKQKIIQIFLKSFLGGKKDTLKNTSSTSDLLPQLQISPFRNFCECELDTIFCQVWKIVTVFNRYFINGFHSGECTKMTIISTRFSQAEIWNKYQNRFDCCVIQTYFFLITTEPLLCSRAIATRARWSKLNNPHKITVPTVV